MHWTEADSTGNGKLDDHHRTLFRMTADFRLALDEGRGRSVYGVLLDSLEVFAAGHFAFEEGLADPECCPVAAKNKEEHRQFLETFSHFRERYDQHGFLQEDAREACTFLEEWLREHIQRVDTHLWDCKHGQSRLKQPSA